MLASLALVATLTLSVPPTCAAISGPASADDALKTLFQGAWALPPGVHGGHSQALKEFPRCSGCPR